LNKEDLTAKDFIGHMLEAAERVLQYTKDLNREEFFASPLVQDAVIRNIEIIGEAANNLLEIGPDIAARYRSIPFAQIYGMRNRVAHGYFSVSLPMIWDSVQVDIPELRQQIATVLGEMQMDS
jgi:uncharacterized protein with HEPN domain